MYCACCMVFQCGSTLTGQVPLLQAILPQMLKAQDKPQSSDMIADDLTKMITMKTRSQDGQRGFSLSIIF